MPGKKDKNKSKDTKSKDTKSKSKSPPKSNKNPVVSESLEPVEIHWIESRHISAREEIFHLTTYCKETERFFDMAEAAKRLAKNGQELSEHEQNLFFEAFQKAITAKRYSWQVLTEIIRRTEGCDKKCIAALEYREQVAKEIETMCNEVITIINEFLLPLASKPVDLVFYYKMLGDHSRYLCEIYVDEQREENVKITIDNYEKALFHAERNLCITNAVRLGLMMNYAVFYKEIQNEIDRAVAMTTKNFDMAMDKITDFDNPDYKDTVVVLQLMRDNITTWLKDQDRIPVDPDIPKEEDDKKEGKSKKSDSKSKKSDKKSSSPKKKK